MRTRVITRVRRDAAGQRRRPELRKIAVTGVATPPRRPRPAEAAPAVPWPWPPPLPGRRCASRRQNVKTENFKVRNENQSAHPHAIRRGPRGPSGRTLDVTGCGLPIGPDAGALMGKCWSKGQYGAYDRPPQGDLPAAVCKQAESGQFPLAVFGVVRQQTPGGVS